MAAYGRLDVLSRLVESGLLPLFHQEDVAVARRILDACMGGGVGVVEFTNRGDGAWRTFTELLDYRRQRRLDVMLGAGSVVDAPTAALYVNSGADFVVGPTFNGAIAELCNRRKVAYIPGCGTLTEIATAEAAGAELVKVFPGEVLGPDFVKAVRGPQPWTSMVVTGGVLAEEASIRRWFEAGATAVGMGSALIRRDWVAAGQYDQIAELVLQVLGWIRRCRPGERR